MNKKAYCISITPRTRLISLSFFLSFSSLLKPILGTDKDSFIPAISIAGLQAGQNHHNSYGGKEGQRYHICILEARNEQKALQEKILAALEATNDLVREIQDKVAEKCERLSLPDSFTEELEGIKLVDPYKLFDENLWCQLAAQPGKGNLALRMEAIHKDLNNFFLKWDKISSNVVGSLTLPINQTFWHQGEWSALFGHGSHGTVDIKGCDLYKWVASFHKVLASLQISFNNLYPTEHGALPLNGYLGLLLNINKDLTRFYMEKNAILWELTTFFLQALPEYEALHDDFFLRPNPYQWVSYLCGLPEAWPTSENWVPKEWAEVIGLADKLRLSLKDKDALTQGEMERIRSFWRDNGKKVWNLLKRGMEKLPKYGRLLDNLYPGTKDIEKALLPARLVKLIKLLDFCDQPMISIGTQIAYFWFLKQMFPLDIARTCMSFYCQSSACISPDLSKKLMEAFSSSDAWKEKAEQFKKELKPFSNTRLVTNLLPSLQSYYRDFEKKYQENFGKTNGCYAPVVSGTMLDGSRFVLSQSMACKVFPALYESVTCLSNIPTPFKSNFVSIPSIQCLHHDSNMDVGKEYAWYFLEKLFGLPAKPSALALFEGILIQRSSTKKIVNFEAGFSVRSSHLIKDPINYQRELRLQESLKSPGKVRSSFKASLGVMQEQFTGMFLEDFLKDVSKGKRSSFDQLDTDSIGRQILFTMLTQSSVPLENWGLIEEKGKFMLTRINRGGGGTQDYTFLHPIFQYTPTINSESQYLPAKHTLVGRNILYLLPFARQKISTAIMEEFRSHDILLILSHWMAELKKTQGYFDDRLRQKGVSSVQSSGEEDQEQEIRGLEISVYRGMIKELIHNFKVMQEILQGEILQGSHLTYLDLLKKLRSQEFELYRDIIRQVEKETQEEGEAKLFFENIIRSQQSEMFLNYDTLAAAQKWLISLNLSPEGSIQSLCSQAPSQAIQYLLESKYEETKQGSFIEAHDTLKACKHLTNREETFIYEGLCDYERVTGRKSKESWPIERVYGDHLNDKQQPLLSNKSPGKEMLGSETSMTQDLISLADIARKTPEQQVEIIFLLLEALPQRYSLHLSWQELFKSIAHSGDPVFIRKFLAIYPRLQQLFGQPPGKSSCEEERPEKSLKKKPSKFFTSQKDDALREGIALHELKYYPAQISRAQEKRKKEEQAPEKAAGDLFRQIWCGSLESLSLEEENLFNTLIDLLLLPRYAGLTELPKELQAMAGYLESTGFASHNHQHVGRSKSSQSGPVALELDDGQHYVLSWSERCATFLQSSKAIPARICQTITSHNVPLLCLEWLRHLQKDGIKITFYPWFLETMIEKATQMQQLMLARPFLTFQEVMQDLWPPIFYAYGQQFYHAPGVKKLCKHLKDQIKIFHNLVTINSSNVDLDWIPDGKRQNLGFILEEMSHEQITYLSKPPLSLTEAAVEVLAYYIPKACGSEVTKIIFGYAAELNVNGGNMSLDKRRHYQTAEARRKEIRRIVGNLIEGNASRQAIQCAVSLIVDHRKATNEKLFNQLLQVAGQKTIKYAIDWYLDWGPTSYSRDFISLQNRKKQDEGIFTFIRKERSLEAKKLAIALYFGCSADCIDVNKNSLKISGIKNVDVMKLRFLIPLFPHINSLDISNNAISNDSLQSLFFVSEGNCFREGMEWVDSLKTLNISGNPIYDPSPLCMYPPIQNVIISDTYIPGEDFLKHIMLYSGFSDLTPEKNQEIVTRSMRKKSRAVNPNVTSSKRSPSSPLISDEVGRIVSFYKKQLISLEQVHRISKLYLYPPKGDKKDRLIPSYVGSYKNFIENSYYTWKNRNNPYNPQSKSAYHHNKPFYDNNIYYFDEQYKFDLNTAKILNLYYNGIVANIVDQMAQNFWGVFLKDGIFFAQDSPLFNYICEVLADPETNASESSRKLIFALRHRLASGVPLDDLVWNKTTETCTLTKLDIKGGTAQTYLGYLTQNLELLAKERKVISKAWYTRVVALAVEQLADNFWKEALAWKEVLKEVLVSEPENKELLLLLKSLLQIRQILTPGNVSFNAWKLAFAWEYDLPKETSRDLGFVLDLQRQPVITSHPYSLASLTISGMDLSRSILGFLAPFSGKYEITLCKNPQDIPQIIKPNQLILSKDEKETYLFCQTSKNTGRNKIRTKDFEKKRGYMVKKFEGYVKQGHWEIRSEHEKRHLLDFTLSQGYTLSGLTKLELTQCGLITTSFLPPAENMTHLNLCGNKITDLSSLYENKTFRYRKLEVLNLSHNILNFTSGDWDDWKKAISHVKEVDFSYNHISIPLVMNQCCLPKNNLIGGKQTFFKIDHNNIDISDIYKFYDLSLFSEKRTHNEMNMLYPKSKNQHPVHIYYESLSNETIFYYEVYNDEGKRKQIKFLGDKEGDKERILKILKTSRPYTEENKSYLFSLIIKQNQINTSRLCVLPQNNRK